MLKNVPTCSIWTPVLSINLFCKEQEQKRAEERKISEMNNPEEWTSVHCSAPVVSSYDNALCAHVMDRPDWSEMSREWYASECSHTEAGTIRTGILIQHSFHIAPPYDGMLSLFDESSEPKCTTQFLMKLFCCPEGANYPRVL